MAYTELEKKIIDLAREQHIDIEAVQKLFDQGADPNAIDTLCEIDPEAYNLLFTDCFTLFYAPDIYPLFVCFLENGFDIKKYAERVVSALVYLGDNDRFKLIQLIFDELTERIPMQDALESIGAEAYFFNTYPKSYKGDKTPVWESNDLEGLCELIETYEKGEEYDGFKQLPQLIDQKLVSITVCGDWIRADEEQMVYGCIDNCMYMIIEMEQDTLFIKDGYTAFINNNTNMERQRNDFTIHAENILKGETVRKVSLHPYSIKVADERTPDDNKCFINGHTVTIDFSGDKAIVFTTDIDSEEDTVYVRG